MGYTFDLETFTDGIALRDEDGKRDYGRDFTVKFPILFWTLFKRNFGLNLFSKEYIYPLPDSMYRSEIMSSPQFDPTLDSVIEMSDEIGFMDRGGDNGFNRRIGFLGLLDFHNDNQKDRYEIHVMGGGAKIFRNGEDDVFLANSSIYTITRDYFNFISEFCEFSTFRPAVTYVYNRLRNEG